MVSKGVSAEIATVLLVGFSLTVSGGLFLSYNSVTQGQGDNVPDIENGVQDIKIENFGKTGNKYRVTVTNDGTNANNVSISQSGQKLNHSILLSGETKTMELGCLNHSIDNIQVNSGSYSKERIVETNEFGSVTGIPEGYCIDITNTEILDNLLEPRKVWEGKVYKNNMERTPYSNSELNVSIDEEYSIIETDNQGRFSFQERWDTNYIDPNGKWSREITYERSANEVDFHRGRGKFQPPNRLRLDYQDGKSRVYQTQEVFKQVESSKISMVYDIVPVAVSDNSVTFDVNVNLTAKAGLENDWNTYGSDSDLLYQIPIPSRGGYSEINRLECSASEDVSCTAGEVTQTLESSTEGVRFDRSNLPTKDNGEKYIPVNMNVTTSEMPYLGSLTSYSYFKYDGAWRRFRVDEREIFIPQGEEFNYTQPVEPSRVENILESRFNDGTATAERNYRQYFGLTSTISGWLNLPRMARADARYALDEEVSSSGYSDSHTIDNVVYNMTDINEGKSMDLNFTVELQRSNTDTKFTLPINLGTLGIFPDNGGEAEKIYNRGGVRYPPYGQTGAYSFSMNIPAEGSSEAIVYKITKPLGNSKWEAKTYVLNTGNQRIENIYLLNSQGRFEEFEGGSLAGGEEISETIDLEQNQDKKVQVNMQFQTINGGISRPEYTGWPYKSFINITGENNYDFDISDDVNCNTRYCINYRTGNRDEAVRIDNLRGSKASKAVFDENLDTIRFYMKNGQDSDGSQGLKNLGFWIWFMQPYEDNLESVLVRPDKFTIKTVENNGLEPGYLVRDFE